MNIFGNPLVIMPRCVQIPSFHTSFMSMPCLFFKPMLVSLEGIQICLPFQGIFNSRASKTVKAGCKHHYVELVKFLVRHQHTRWLEGLERRGVQVHNFDIVLV